jgi:hypothetical protein
VFFEPFICIEQEWLAKMPVGPRMIDASLAVLHHAASSAQRDKYLISL